MINGLDLYGAFQGHKALYIEIIIHSDNMYTGVGELHL